MPKRILKAVKKYRTKKKPGHVIVTTPEPAPVPVFVATSEPKAVPKSAWQKIKEFFTVPPQTDD